MAAPEVGAHRRALAQLAEHRSPKPKVGGSSPSCPAERNRSTIKDELSEKCRRLSGSKRTERTSPVTFYRQVVAELRKVVWPTQEQLVTYFVVVMVFVVVMMTLVSALDLGFGKLVFEVFAGGSKQ